MTFSKVSVVVHGGAGMIPDSNVQAHKDGVKKACMESYQMLLDGANAADAAQKAMEIMELDPIFNCGIGSTINSDGYIELDAIIGDDKYNIGAVGGISNFVHPIRIARAIRDKTGHILLVGEGGNEFGKLIGEKQVLPEKMLAGKGLVLYQKLLNQKNQKSRAENWKELEVYDNVVIPGQELMNNKILDKGTSDTVGVVCKDKEGNTVVALSTGGSHMKMPGRVGDTPLWGSGAYAEDGCGAATTGYGEDLIKALITKSMVDRINVEKPTPQNTQMESHKQIEVLGSKINGRGGIICLDKEGNPGIAFNTQRMSFAFCVEGDERGLVVGVDHEDIPKF
ncbi:hypothetical protein BB559_001359 [Furculomyces boomerangus]|uniref:beta-aspartyl-peptidase n=2 Tax=Harpellales TaxID=61421 RepID=A0A2T9Z275_9FUNG|nr:hypothetical protein BB559_001359 [Furculomyces boomerangus]PWA02126.1 hypothetical protein BB558_001740 [Smittium angustum]